VGRPLFVPHLAAPRARRSASDKPGTTPAGLRGAGRLCPVDDAAATRPGAEEEPPGARYFALPAAVPLIVGADEEGRWPIDRKYRQLRASF